MRDKVARTPAVTSTVAKPSKQQIATVRSALRDIHVELLAWGPHAVVAFDGEAQKAQIVARMRQLGWHYVDDPGNETANVSLVEFSLDPTTAPSDRAGSGGVRRVKLAAAFFASFGVIFALAGLIIAAMAFQTDYHMRSLARDGTLTTGQIERTYSILGHGGRTYYVSYRFSDAQGISHEGEDPYPFQDWNGLRPGATISVTYLTNDPQRNNLTQRVRLIADRSPKEEMIWIGIPWIIAAGFFLGYWARRRPS